jgi:hypothetical protein
LLITRDTVVYETPASRATSIIVGPPLLRVDAFGELGRVIAYHVLH